MANNYFKFKQFTIYQDKCAMKVCTDACLFGALLPGNVNGKALDIGTGTGLLSLMLAQKSPCTLVDALEIDENACEQAKANFSESPWDKSLNLIKGDINQFKPLYQYNFIFSNPPFYENDLKSSDKKRNLAMHSDGLKYDDLLANVVRLLDPNGSFAVLLPYHTELGFINKALSSGLFLSELIRVKQSVRHSFFRSILFFSKQNKDITALELAIKDEHNAYTQAFADLLKDYYLFL